MSHELHINCAEGPGEVLPENLLEDGWVEVFDLGQAPRRGHFCVEFSASGRRWFLATLMSSPSLVETCRFSGGTWAKGLASPGPFLGARTLGVNELGDLMQTVFAATYTGCGVLYDDWLHIRGQRHLRKIRGSMLLWLHLDWLTHGVRS